MPKIARTFYTIAGHAGFILIIVSIIVPLYVKGVNLAYLFLIGVVSVAVLMPALNYFYNLMARYSFNEAKTFVSPEKLDVIFQAQTVDDLINSSFERMLSLLSTTSGRIIIHNFRSDSFDLYEQSKSRKRVVRNAPIDATDPLIKGLIDGKGIIIRKRLDPRRGYDARLCEELELHDAEIAAPIYYQERFLGALLVGPRMTRYSSHEIELVSSFASKIGTMFMNSFLWRESVEKKDIEREFELGKKVQNNFYPPMSGIMGGYDYALSFPRAHGTYRQFCDLYSEFGDLSLSLFVNTDPTPGSFVFLPSVIPLLQTFFRKGGNPSESVVKTMSSVVERGITDAPLRLAYFKFSGRHVEWARTGYGAPLIFNLATEEALFAHDDGFAGSCDMHRGLLFLIFDEEISQSIGRHYDAIVRELTLHKLGSLRTIANAVAESMFQATKSRHLVGVFRLAR
jgi:hypothetical protein